MFLGNPEPKLEKNHLLAELNKGRGHDHEIWGDYALAVAGLEGLSAGEQTGMVQDSELVATSSEAPSHDHPETRNHPTTS